jgi:hypothetical protein
MRKNDILEAIEAELCGIIYSGNTLIPHHIVEVISKYKDNEEEIEEWDWDEHDGYDTWNEAPYGDDDDED